MFCVAPKCHFQYKTIPLDWSNRCRLNVNLWISVADIDECAEGLHNCSRQSQSCVNGVGNFRCVDREPDCHFGYRYDPLVRRCEGNVPLGFYFGIIPLPAFQNFEKSSTIFSLEKNRDFVENNQMTKFPRRIWFLDVKTESY